MEKLEREEEANWQRGGRGALIVCVSVCACGPLPEERQRWGGGVLDGSFGHNAKGQENASVYQTYPPPPPLAVKGAGAPSLRRSPYSSTPSPAPFRFTRTNAAPSRRQTPAKTCVRLSARRTVASPGAVRARPGRTDPPPSSRFLSSLCLLAALEQRRSPAPLGATSCVATTKSTTREAKRRSEHQRRAARGAVESTSVEEGDRRHGRRRLPRSSLPTQHTRAAHPQGTRLCYGGRVA